MMEYIDMHAHMVSRTTDDYHRMALTGCVAVTEPAFWAGFDRGSADAFEDYFRQLTDFEPKRAAQYGVRSVPTVMLFAGGDVKRVFVGARSAQEYRAGIDDLLH